MSRSTPARQSSARDIPHLRVARPLQHNRSVRRALLALAVALVPGCFYTDSINERPSADIVRTDSGAVVRLGTVNVQAEWNDPNHDVVNFAWSVQACDGMRNCDPPFVTSTQSSLTIVVPPARNNVDDQFTKLAIWLDVSDTHGAHANPVQELVLDVLDPGPSLSLAADGRQWPTANLWPVGLPITVRATASAPGGAAVTLAWEPLYSPGSTTNDVAWGTETVDPATDVHTNQFTPDAAGAWTVRVQASDGLKTDEQTLMLLVQPDQPPCLGTTDPALASGTIVVDQARRFSVLSVDDDIDVFPPPPATAKGMGTTGFHWSLASPASGGALVPIGADANDVVIDPTQYAPGDQLDLRVDITDAVTRTPCDASQPTCSVAGNTCLQRQTWHLEIAQ